MRSKTVFVLVISLLVVSVIINVVFRINKLEPKNINENDDSYVTEEEEYIYIAVFKRDPMIELHDVKGLEQFSSEYGVKTTIMAPESFNVQRQIDLLEDAISKKPAGIMVCGSDKKLIPYINRAFELGIPIITVDADLTESKRIAFVGSDWYDIGVKQAEAMVKLIGGKGTVAMLGIANADIMIEGFNGFRDVMSNYEEVTVLKEFDDMSNQQTAYEIAKQLILSNPEIVGIAGFDSNSGPGIARAVEELNMTGKIKVTCVDAVPLQLEYVKKGLIQKVIGQKRELFTYYGGKLLYYINHSDMNTSIQGIQSSFASIPFKISTGLFEIDESNVYEYTQSVGGGT